MESLESGPVLLSVGFIGFFSITLFVRRWLASRRSGGSFFEPYHISKGIFYIHVPLCFSRRMIPLKEMKQITYLLLSVVALVVEVAMLSISNSEMERPFPSFSVEASGMNCWLKNSSKMLVSMGLKYIFNARIQSPEGNKTRI